MLPAIILWVISAVGIFFTVAFITLELLEMRDDDAMLMSIGIALVGSTLFTILNVIATRKEEAKKAAEEAEKQKRAEARRKADEAKKEKRRKANEAAKKRREEAKQKRIKELNEKYGEPFGTSVYNKKVVKGMSDAAVEESWGTPKLIKNDSWYYRDKKRRILSLVTFKKNKVSDIVEKSQLVELKMSKKDVIAIWGEPGDEKETVFKTTTKLRLYYFPRTTRQNRTAYGYEIKLEDDIVVGWKALD